MNLMFRKNFATDKGGGGGGERIGGGGSILGPGLSAPGKSGGLKTGLTLNAGRYPARRSRDYGFATEGEHATSHSYRTHLFLSPPAGPPPEEEPRFGPGPRRNSGPHLIKWGGNTSAAQAAGKRKQQAKELGETSAAPGAGPPPRQVRFYTSFFCN